MSPPFLEFPDCTHQPGDLLDGDLFPVIRDAKGRGELGSGLD
jgi:hypothetical protein